MQEKIHRLDEDVLILKNEHLLMMVINDLDDRKIYQKNIQLILYRRIVHDELNQIENLLNEWYVEYVVRVNGYEHFQLEDK